jgi:hypothetical protein
MRPSGSMNLTSVYRTLCWYDSGPMPIVRTSTFQGSIGSRSPDELEAHAAHGWPPESGLNPLRGLRPVLVEGSCRANGSDENCQESRVRCRNETGGQVSQTVPMDGERRRAGC